MQRNNIQQMLFKLSLALFLILTPFLFPLTVFAALEDGLVAHYPLDGDVSDISLSANNGSINGAVPTFDRNGNPDGAIAFDGVDDSLLIPHISALNMNVDGFAVSFFIKVAPDQIGRSFAIFDKFNQFNCFGTITGWTIQNALAGPNVSYAYGDYANLINIPGPSLVDDQWHHVLVMIDLGTISFYIDGELLASQLLESSPVGNTAPLNVGKWACGASRFFHGALDDIRFYNRPLSGEEIAILNNTTEEKPPITPEPPVEPEPIDPDTLRPIANTDLVIQSVSIDPITGEVSIKATLDSASAAWSDINRTPDIRLTMEVKSNDGSETPGIVGDNSVPLLTDEQTNKLIYGAQEGDIEDESAVCEVEDTHNHKHDKHPHHKRGKHHRSPTHGGYDAKAWWENKFKELRENRRHH